MYPHKKNKFCIAGFLQVKFHLHLTKEKTTKLLQLNQGFVKCCNTNMVFLYKIDIEGFHKVSAKKEEKLPPVGIQFEPTPNHHWFRSLILIQLCWLAQLDKHQTSADQLWVQVTRGNFFLKKFFETPQCQFCT